MKLNSNLVIQGKKCLLVPYRKEHVALYHSWMQDATLQELTSSEPLTMEEEYEMQRDWEADEQKCTMIILDPSFPDSPGTGCHGGAMAGDVNAFFNDPEQPHTAEISIMVAEPRSRRKGIAEEALTLFMAYCALELGVSKFRAKVGEANVPSLRLMSKAGFTHVTHSAIWREVTLELVVEEATRERLLEVASQLDRQMYEDHPN